MSFHAAFKRAVGDGTTKEVTHRACETCGPRSPVSVALVTPASLRLCEDAGSGALEPNEIAALDAMADHLQARGP